MTDSTQACLDLGVEHRHIPHVLKRLRIIALCIMPASEWAVARGVTPREAKNTLHNKENRPSFLLRIAAWIGYGRERIATLLPKEG